MINFKDNKFDCISFNELNDGCSIMIQPNSVEVYINHILQFTQQKINDGNPVHLVEIQGLTVAIVIGTDILVPEIGRYLALKKVQLVICVDYNREVHDLMLGPWNMSQSNCIYVIYYTNEPLLYAPCDLTVDYCGQLLEGILSKENLSKAYQSFPILDSLNPILYEEKW